MMLFKKNLMKKLMICLGLLITLTFAVSAQTRRPALTEEQKKEFKTKMEAYKAELKLTAEQQPKFEAINLEFAEALAALKEDSGARLGKLRKLKSAANDRNKKMKDLLTTEQYKIFQARQGELKDELKSRRN